MLINNQWITEDIKEEIKKIIKKKKIYKLSETVSTTRPV